jgi:methionine synthase II (cobalamin-independent)
MRRVEALNYAIRGLPEERIRFHLCWGSWHGPHTTDIPMADIIDVMLAINAGAYSFEAANVRHEHEWKVWRDVKLPAGKVILPGVRSAGRTWWPPPTAVSAVACTRRSPGRSSPPGQGRRAGHRAPLGLTSAPAGPARTFGR